MKLKRMVSAIAALAVSVTTFAGMAVTANAENPSETIYAKASGTVNYNNGYLGVNPVLYMAMNGADQKTNSWGSDGMIAFDMPEIQEGYSVKNATLVLYLYEGAQNRTSNRAINVLGMSNYVEPINTTIVPDIGETLDCGTVVTNVLASTNYQNTGTEFGRYDVTKYVNQQIDSDSNFLEFYLDAIFTGSATSAHGTYIYSAYQDENIYKPQIIIEYIEGTDVEYGEKVNVNYMCNAESIAAGTENDISNKVIGIDTYAYTYPAYILNGNSLYKSVLDYYSNELMITEKNPVINIEYSSVGTGTYQYMEFDGNTDIANANKASNGEMMNGIQGGVATLTVAEDGVYDVVIATGRTSGEATSTRTGKWYINDDSDNSNDLTFSGQNPGEHEYGGVELHKGDVIKVQGANSKCALDYVLIKKTGDIVVPIPGVVPATHVEDYTDAAATDATTGASLWNAVITGNGTGFNKIRVDGVIKSGEDTVKTAGPVTENLGTTITTGSAYIYIAVNQAVSKLEDGQTMEVTVTPVSE